MKLRTGSIILVLVIGGSLLSGCMSLAADITPPPNLQAPQPVEQQPVEVSTVFPIVPPDPTAGKAIYETSCMPCHGADGNGDGSMSGNLPEPPPEIGNPELARQSRPADWYWVVTNGNLEKLMPGFVNSLDDRSRWDVVAYVYSLSTTAEEMAAGQAVYAAKCVECHGMDGRGDGQAPDLTDQQRMSQLSAQELEAVLAAGQGSMPGFAETLSESERWAAVSYVRSLTFGGLESSPSVAEEPQAQPTATALAVATEAPVAGSTLTIRGTISNPGGSPLPADIAVKLFGFEGMAQAFELSTTPVDGVYEFTDVTVTEGMAYMVQVDAGGYSFGSDILHAVDVTGAVAELPVSIYDTSTDPSGLTVDRMHVFFDFAVAEKVQVVELFIVSNTSDKVIVPSADGTPALTFGLPEGATNLLFDSGELGDRYVTTENGFGDLTPIVPGTSQHQVLFSFDMPYEKKLDLSLPILQNVASVVVMLPPEGVKMESGQLMSAGQRNMSGLAFDMYTGSALTAGSSLDMRLSGKVSSVKEETNTFSGIAIGATVFGLALIGTGVWLYRQRKTQEEEVAESEVAEEQPEESEEALLDAILALDDLHQAGKLPEDAYQERRAALKERLRILHARGEQQA
ncbi:MAG: c-type cytochrome [Anaerolineaceae bacterium]|nr:c-type cytochrome [Anaerolineaceae bacterium]